MTAESGARAATRAGAYPGVSASTRGHTGSSHVEVVLGASARRTRRMARLCERAALGSGERVREGPAAEHANSGRWHTDICAPTRPEVLERWRVRLQTGKSFEMEFAPR
jgi:hypothetical protein